ncbi:hypothetical protein DY000_02059166 [Brassica cretica]|uniref:Uncharacterized protein n=1 Tax=Brassica cretica TaxID=69181 RepID=A0ABQ7ARI2_BRACR|nr:hypothetical protein DY000_02059166 [Brassica cretica]
MEQEIMNFISQRFFSPSICEYPILEEDSSPKKKLPKPKPIIEVKRSLFDFHKAQDLEKWSRKLEDMINFPKPAKPALHLPYLEDLNFTSNQRQEWQPGELLTPKHLDLSSLLSIESCGILNPPSFHSNSFAKLESDTHPASKEPSRSTSIIN